MPDPNNTSLLEFNGWTLRVREATESPPRLLLLIHGFTGDENSMWVFARSLSPRYWMVAPRAPHVAQAGGYSWRPAQYGNMDHVSLDMLGASAAELIRLVDDYSASAGIDAGTFDLMGFSQGAAMCNVLAFLYPQRVRRVGILAGFAPLELQQLVAQHPLAGKPFFVAHGTRDEMVDVQRARDSIAMLEGAGAKVTYCEDAVGHKVSVTCLRALKEFFTD